MPRLLSIEAREKGPARRRGGSSRGA